MAGTELLEVDEGSHCQRYISVYLQLKCEQASDLWPVKISTKNWIKSFSISLPTRSYSLKLHNLSASLSPSVRGVTEDSGNWQRQPFLTVGRDLSKWWECETSSTVPPAGLDPLHAGEIEMHPAAGGSMSPSQLPQQPIIFQVSHLDEGSGSILSFIFPTTSLSCTHFKSVFQSLWPLIVYLLSHPGWLTSFTSPFCLESCVTVASRSIIAIIFTLRLL